MKDMKKILTMAGALVIVVVAGVWFMFGGIELIEDTNGPDNFSLETITDQEIIDRSTGSIGGPNISQGLLTGMRSNSPPRNSLAYMRSFTTTLLARPISN